MGMLIGCRTPLSNAHANFRLLHRLLVQVERVLKINKRTAITDVIDAARSMLVIGAN